jgi:c-di-GMP-binding flagellar brake protein YcgR
MLLSVPDRRSSTRLRQSSLVLLQPEEAKAPAERAWLVDVSAGGVALQAPEATGLEVDALVMIELPLGTSQSRIKTRCRVVAHSQRDGKEVVHMEFLDDSELFAETLEKAMRSWQQRDATATFHGEWW